MTIPTSLTLTESDLILNNSGFNSDGSIAVSNSEVEIDVSLSGALVSEIQPSLVNELTPIPLESNSTNTELVLTETNYNIVSELNSLVNIDNNEISILNKTSDFTLATSSSPTNRYTFYSLMANSAFNSACLYNNVVYVFGGDNGSGAISTIYSATYDSTTGAISNWSTSSISLPIPMVRYSLAQNGNTIYLIGSSSSTAVYYTTINSDGSLNDFTTTTSLPVEGNYEPPISFIYNGYLYLFTIYVSNSSTSTFYYAPVNSDGSLGTWVAQSVSTSIPNTANPGLAQNNGYYYIVGGGNYAGYSYSNTYYGVINSDGSLGEPITGTSLPVDLRAPNLICYKNMLIALNSFETTSNPATGTIYISPINSDGSIGSWYAINNENSVPAGYNAYVFNPTTGIYSNLTGAVSHASESTFVTTAKALNFNDLTDEFVRNIILGEGILVGEYYYVLGGQNGSVLNSVLYAPYDASTQSFGSWTFTTPLPTTLVSFALAENNGYLYVISGATNGGNYPTNSSSDYTNTTYYAPINSDGSIGAWVTSTETLPVLLGMGKALVVDNVLYLITSFQSTGIANYNVYYSVLNSDGSLGAWNTQSNVMSTSTQSGGSALTNYESYYYVVGGSNSSYWALSQVTLLTLDTTTNQFTATTQTALPVALRRPNAFVYNSTLYVQDGGNPDTSFINTNLYSAPIASDGTIGSWSTAPNPLAGLYVNILSYDTVNNLIINIGGIENFNGSGLGGGYANIIPLSNISIYSPTATSISSDVFITAVPSFTLLTSSDTGNNQEETQIVYYNDFLYLFVAYEEIFYILNTKTNIWTTSSFPTVLYIPSMLVYNNTIYVFGGIVDGVGSISSIYYATINSDGSIGTFTESSNSLPGPVLTPNNTYVNNNYAYIFGGIPYNGSSYSFNPDVYQCSLNDATLTSWTTYNSILESLGANIIAGDSTIVNNYFIIGNDSVVLFIYPESSTSTGILSAPVDSTGNISNFVLVTPNIPILGQVQYVLNLNNGGFIINTLYNSSIYTYLGSVDNMTSFSLIDVSTAISYTAPITLLINEMPYIYSSPNVYKALFNNNGGSALYTINLTTALGTVPTSIYVPSTFSIFIKFNSWSNKEKLNIESTNISDNQITYNFSSINNTSLISEVNYPKVYIETESYSSKINSLSFSTTSYPI